LPQQTRGEIWGVADALFYVVIVVLTFIIDHLLVGE
jgi:hypothetical protein